MYSPDFIVLKLSLIECIKFTFSYQTNIKYYLFLLHCMKKAFKLNIIVGLGVHYT